MALATNNGSCDNVIGLHKGLVQPDDKGCTLLEPPPCLSLLLLLLLLRCVVLLLSCYLLFVPNTASPRSLIKGGVQLFVLFVVMVLLYASCVDIVVLMYCFICFIGVALFVCVCCFVD